MLREIAHQKILFYRNGNQYDFLFERNPNQNIQPY